MKMEKFTADDVRCENFHFSRLQKMSSRIISYNWQNTPLEIALDALRQIDLTWHRFVTVNLKLVQQHDVGCDKLFTAHDLYIKCKNCVQHRINQIMAASDVQNLNHALSLHSRDKLPKHRRTASCDIPMVKIPIPIIVELLRENRSTRTENKRRMCENTKILNEMPLPIRISEIVCVCCSKRIKNTNFVKCTGCETNGHFGCLHRAKLVRKRADTRLWKCQKCLKCHRCAGTRQLVNDFSHIFHFSFHKLSFVSFHFSIGNSIRMQFMPKCFPFALFARSDYGSCG